MSRDPWMRVCAACRGGGGSSRVKHEADRHVCLCACVLQGRWQRRQPHGGEQGNHGAVQGNSGAQGARLYCCTATVEAIGFRDAESASSLGCLPGAVYQGLSARGCFISLRPPLNLPGPPPCHPACRPRLCRSMCSCCWTAGRSSLCLGTTPPCWMPSSTLATATRAASEWSAGWRAGLARLAGVGTAQCTTHASCQPAAR